MYTLLNDGQPRVPDNQQIEVPSHPIEIATRGGSFVILFFDVRVYKYH